MAFGNLLEMLSTLIILLLVSTSLADNTDCNVILKLTSQTLTENVYRVRIDEPFASSGNKKSCWFTFETFADYGLKIEFEKFVLQEPDCFENNSLTDGCCDFVEVGLGDEVDENSHQRFCGWLKYSPFILNSNKGWLKYSIENFESFEGAIIKVRPFKLVFNHVKKGIISTETDYFNQMDLTYKILMENDSIISFNFLGDFSMEKYADKCIDYVEIGALDSVTLEPIGNATKYCGQQLPSQFSLNTHTAYVHLVTNENVLDNGFKLEFLSLKYLFTESTGAIQSQSKPMNITYKIVAPNDKKIELTITEFNLLPCINQDMDEAIQKMNTNNNDVCSLNHHMIVRFN